MQTDIYHIIAEKLKGRAGEADLLLLEEWLNEKPGNRETYAELEKVWELTGTLEQTTPADVDREWEKFVALRDSSADNTFQLPQKRFEIKLFLRYAAILLPLLALVSLTVFFMAGRNKQAEWITITTASEKQQVILPDGTTVWLNHNSSLQYPRQFSRQNRNVTLTGEAFFDVTGTGASFAVDAGRTTVEVLGTRFNVNYYRTDSVTLVYVEEGKVMFSAKDDGQNRVRLGAGEIGIFRGQQNPIIKEKAGDENIVAWVNDTLVFDNTPLYQVERDIEAFFGVDLVIAPELENCLFSGEFANPKLKNVLEVICLSTGSSLRYQGSKIYLEGGSCK